MDIQTTLNLLFEQGDQDQIFSYILCRLSPSYIISNDNVSRAFSDLLSRGSNDEVFQILQNNLPSGLTLRSISNAVDSPGERVCISERVQSIACSLAETEEEEEEEEEEEGEGEEEGEKDLESRARSYWQDVRDTEGKTCRIELDPIERLKHFDKKASEIAKSVSNLSCRDTLVQILMENERELISHRIKAQLQKTRKKEPSDIKVSAEVNAYIAKMIGKKAKDVKNLSQGRRKYLNVVKSFGPGISKYLRGHRRDWRLMNDKECDILKAFIRNRPGLVRSAQEHNTEIAAALLHGMLKSGFPAKDFDTSNTTIINMIKRFVGVTDKGRIFERKIQQQVQIDVISTPATEESAKKLREIITRKRTTNKEQGSRKKPRPSYHQPSFATQCRDDDNDRLRQFNPPASSGQGGQADLTGNQQASINTSIYYTPWNTYNMHSSSQEPSPHLFDHLDQLDQLDQLAQQPNWNTYNIHSSSQALSPHLFDQLDQLAQQPNWNTYNIHSNGQPVPPPRIFHEQQLSWPGNMFTHDNNPAIYSSISPDRTIVTPQSRQTQTSFHPLMTAASSIPRRSDQLLNPISVF